MFAAAIRNILKRSIHNKTLRKRFPHAQPKITVKDLIAETLKDKSFKTVSDWHTVRNEIIQTNDHITENNVDFLMIDYCLSTHDFSLGKSYFEFLKQNNLKPNLATVGKYLRLIYYAKKDSGISSDEEEEIQSIFKELQEQYKVFDSYTAENLILALSKTRNWKYCLNLLNEMKILCMPSQVAYSSIICAALQNKQLDLCWSLLQEMLDDAKVPQNDVYYAYIEFCKNSPAFQEHIVQLLHLLQRYDLKLNEEAANRLATAAKQLDFDANLANIQPTGVCQSCKGKLNLLQVSPEEFDNLRSEVFKSVVIGKNIFCKSTPDEVNQFKSFLEKIDKFDVVVDGLNVAYLVGTKQPDSVTSGFVVTVVNHFVRQNKKVLVCGRAHMKKWPKRNLDVIYSKASVFLTENLSQDDPYLLYCALHCGLNTIIISKDLMRSHLYLLKNAYYRSLFKRWLSQNLYQISFVDKNGRITFKPKLPYVTCVQKHGDRWHVPYEVTGLSDTLRWVCLKL